MQQHYAKQYGAALEVQDARKGEAHVLVEIARRMDGLQQTESPDREEMIELFKLNWRLWTIFQSELSNPGNPLPDEIKINMLNLANFIDLHTVEAIRNPQPKAFSVLININRNVAAGLLGDQVNPDQQEAGGGSKDTTSAKAALHSKPKPKIKKVTIRK